MLQAGACALWRPPPEPLATEALELTTTPFFPQRDYQCGPAALATLLGASGIAVQPDDLVRGLYVPERHGTLQVELVAAARRHGRLAVRVDGELPSLVSQLRAGRPVLVLQNLASSLVPVWHYAVVVGYRPEGDQFVLRSGRKRRELVGRGRFAATWRRADEWAIVLLAPEAEPAGVAPRAYLHAAAELESVGEYAMALQAFRVATAAWPDDPTARLGVANNLYYLGDLGSAAEAYSGVLALRPGDPVAVHNLVSVELERGHWCAARNVLELAGDGDGELLDAARRAVAEARSTAGAAGCHADPPPSAGRVPDGDG